jgi:DNA-directed RNA polymerase specialized sigma24 family protein
LSEWAPNFDQLLYANQGMVFGLALHFLRDRTSAEEIAQDVFLALHKNLRAITCSMKGDVKKKLFSPDRKAGVLS